MLAQDTVRTEQEGSEATQRVYALVEVAQGQSEEVVSCFRRQPGVVMADVVEGKTIVMMVVEAGHVIRLAQLTIRALAAVERVILGIHLMPACRS